MDSFILDNTQQFQICINGVDYTKQLVPGSISGGSDMTDYSCKFQLYAYNPTQVETFRDLFCAITDVYSYGKLIASGYLYSGKENLVKTQNGIITKMDFELNTYQWICSKIAAAPIINGPVEDSFQQALNNAECFFFNYAAEYLEPRGIVVNADNISTNLTIREMTDTDLPQNPTLKEVFDYLAEKTKSDWGITREKIFWVRNGMYDPKTYEHRFTDSLDATKEQYFNMKSISSDVSEHFNTFIIHGSKEHAEVSPDYVGEDGALYMVVENTADIERRAALSGGSGVFTKEETNDNINTVEEMEKYATQMLERYCRNMMTVEFECYHAEDLKTGDFITIDSEAYGLTGQLLCIDKISYKTRAALDYETIWTLTCTMRNDNKALGSYWSTVGKGTTTEVQSGGGSTPTVVVKESMYANDMVANIISSVETYVDVEFGD